MDIYQRPTLTDRCGPRPGTLAKVDHQPVLSTCFSLTVSTQSKKCAEVFPPSHGTNTPCNCSVNCKHILYCTSTYNFVLVSNTCLIIVCKNVREFYGVYNSLAVLSAQSRGPDTVSEAYIYFV